MKILGFIFQTKPNVHAHIKYCISKYNKALWALNHLKRANIDTITLLETYKVMLRPLLEYCCAVYNPMLNQEQVKQLERQQSTALKIIYGFEKDYDTLLSLSGINSLRVRREAAFEKFAINLARSNRYAGWLPEKERGNLNLRTTSKYEETFTRTQRRYNSPLFTIRRTLNDLELPTNELTEDWN